MRTRPAIYRATISSVFGLLVAAAASAQTVYDFTGITSPSATHTAEDGEIDVADSMIENGTFPARRGTGIDGWDNWGEASSAEYAALVGSDDVRYEGAGPGLGDNAAMLFTFYVAEAPGDIEQIDVSVELGRVSSTDLAWVYLWDYNTSAYLVLGSQSGTADQVVSASIDVSPGDYVETGTGQLTVFVVNEDTNDAIWVDDISVIVVTAVCGDGTQDPGEECDDGNTDPDDCCSPTCQYESTATVCRDAIDVCDLAETCDGKGNCPADAYQPTTTECRAAAGICEIALFCDGVNTFCPPLDWPPPPIVCRPSAGVCDPEEYCDEYGGICPPDVLEPTTTECRGDAGDCDVPEFCPGDGVDCPSDVYEPAGTPCDDANPYTGNDRCDGDGVCMGTPGAVPALNPWVQLLLGLFVVASGAGLLAQRKGGESQ